MNHAIGPMIKNNSHAWGADDIASLAFQSNDRTPAAWMTSVLNPVPGVGVFNQALVDYLCLAPKA